MRHDSSQTIAHDDSPLPRKMPPEARRAAAASRLAMPTVEFGYLDPGEVEEELDESEDD
jgi:hypothetical protein